MASRGRPSSSWLRGLRLEELQGLHAQLLLAVVETHGVQAAMHLIGSSLQWLALASAANARPPAPDSRHAHGQLMEHGLRWHERRWHAALCKALCLNDPWVDGDWSTLSYQRALRRCWDQIRRRWVNDDLLICWERQPFAHGSMRQCHRMKATRQGWKRPLYLLGKRYFNEAASIAALEADVRMQMRAKEYGTRYSREAGVPKSVDFVQAFMIHVIDEGPVPPVFASEAFIEGEFVKHSSNSG
eukprot:6198472-Pleurochrysis_carterae.AAC.6